MEKMGVQGLRSGVVVQEEVSARAEDGVVVLVCGEEVGRGVQLGEVEACARQSYGYIWLQYYHYHTKPYMATMVTITTRRRNRCVVMINGSLVPWACHGIDLARIIRRRKCIGR